MIEVNDYLRGNCSKMTDEGVDVRRGGGWCGGGGGGGGGKLRTFLQQRFITNVSCHQYFALNPLNRSLLSLRCSTIFDLDKIRIAVTKTRSCVYKSKCHRRLFIAFKNCLLKLQYHFHVCHFSTHNSDTATKCKHNFQSSLKNNIWWPLSLLLRHWKKINWNRLINKHWDWHPTGEARSLIYYYYFYYYTRTNSDSHIKLRLRLRTPHPPPTPASNSASSAQM